MADNVDDILGHLSGTYTPRIPALDFSNAEIRDDRVAYRSNVLPLVKERDGSVRPGWPQGVVDVMGAVLAPGRVARGEAEPTPEMAAKMGMALGGTSAGLRGAGVKGGDLGIFAGKRAKTADLDALKRAEAMEAAGKGADDIWRETGWGRGADGDWRFEIDDSNAGVFLRNDRSRRLREAVNHPDLHEAYPDVGEGTVMGVPGDGASYAPGSIERYRVGWDGDHRASMLHEIQHAAQNREGFGRGSSPNDVRTELLLQRMRESPDAPIRAVTDEDVYDAYSRVSGEVEARNVEHRRGWSADKRRATPPWVTEDVPRDQQIIRRR